MSCSKTTTDSRWGHMRQSRIMLACVVALSLFTDMLVYGAVIPCLPALVIDRLKGDSRMVGLLFGCYAFGHLLATPAAAVLSDRYQNRRYPMLVGLFGLAISTLSFAVANSYSWLVIARMAQGMAGGSTWTIGLGMLADVFEADRLGVVMGTVISAHSVGFVLGPVMGGFLYETGGLQAPFLVCTAVAIVNFLAVVWIDEPKHATTVAAPDEASPLLHRDGPRVTILTLLREKRVLCCLFCSCITSAVVAGIEPVLPIYLRDTFAASTSTIGLVFIAMSLPSFVGPLVGYTSDKLGRPYFILSGVGVMACATLLASLRLPSLHWILGPMMLLGLSSSLIHTPLIPTMGAIVHDMGSDAYAQAYALYNMAYSCGMFVGPVLAGYMMAELGFRPLMVVFSVVLLVCSPVLLFI